MRPTHGRRKGMIAASPALRRDGASLRGRRVVPTHGMIMGLAGAVGAFLALSCWVGW